MSPDEQRARSDAENVAVIANAVVAMNPGDRRQAAAGLIVMAKVLVEGDELGAAVLSSVLRSAAAELDLQRVDLRWVN